ncbi:FYVE-domain-containing protein, partial [Laetiporus sulphureus 93-53]
VNAASKGHLPVVLYLLTKQSADPFVRNNWGETAYDVAAAVFEVWICEVLQKTEAEHWHINDVPYNPLAVHTTVPLVLYENQRLDVRLKTLAVSGGRPKFSASGLGRHGRRAPFELRLPVPEANTGRKEIPALRSDVQLPLREDPWTLPKSGSAREGAERSHFWLSDWTLDVTHPGVDAEDGWQYAHSFDDPDDAWTAELPLQLERLLSGSGAVTAGLGGSRSRSSSRGRSSSSSRHDSSHSQSWVRRRRWVRVMRRRLDIPPLPFLQPDGAMYNLTADGSLIPYVEQDEDVSDSDGQELGAMSSTGLSSAQDYVARARYLAGTQDGDAESSNGAQSALEARRAIAKLERATTELSQGILNDQDSERKTQAEVLLNTYGRELNRRRLSAGAQGLFFSGDDGNEIDSDDSDDEFHYPGSGSTSTPRPSSVRSSGTDYFSSRPSGTRGPADLTPHLSQAPEFRVPTHEAPQKVLLTRWTPPTPHQVHAQWERDEVVSECRECRRRFNFLNRRHCRRCGRIFCDRCSSWRALLDPSDVVHDPSFPETDNVPTLQRVCRPCYEEATAGVPSGLSSARTTSMERIVVDQRRLTVPSPSSAESSSQLSDLAECPVCNTNLADLGPASEQEAHVRNCLEGGSGTTPQTAKYLVYKLPAESALIGLECAICLEEFVKGSTVARLSCLCSFHNACLSSWLQRGRSCPVHAR